MSGSTSTTATKLWKKMATKDYRDAYVAAHVSNTVASQISMLRDKEGWTQKQLAQKSGMSQSRISALEDPNYENYEIGTLKRVASAFDVGLTVRFCPYSEIVTWVSELSPLQLAVPTFAEDRISATTAAWPQIKILAKFLSEIVDAAEAQFGPIPTSEVGQPKGVAETVAQQLAPLKIHP